MDRVIDSLTEADDGEGLVTMLRHQDLQYVLVDEATPPATDPDVLAGPFAHIVVDEAQELTDAQWAMLRRRCPSRSLTVVGDRAQARHGFPEPWQERLARVGLDRVQVATLTINYRTPEEVMAEAEAVIRAVLPDANVPVSIRSTGVPVMHGAVCHRDTLLEEWLAAHPDGTGCVIADVTFPGAPRVRSLTPELAKGLEFDLVVLVDPDTVGAGTTGGVDRYVAMTRATQQLIILTANPDPDPTPNRTSAGAGTPTDVVQAKEGEPVPSAVQDPGPLFHGTKADLAPGDLLDPGHGSNYGQRSRATYVYLTATLDAAVWGAELALGEAPGRIYRVEPTGPIEDDPNLTNQRFPGSPTRSYRTRQPLRVLHEVLDWHVSTPQRCFSTCANTWKPSSGSVSKQSTIEQPRSRRPVQHRKPSR